VLTFQTSLGGGALATEQFGYDANLRPTSASATWQNGSGSSGTILSQSRSYDAVSNVTSVSTVLSPVPGVNNSGGSEVQNFCYDEQNRLVWAGNSGTQPGAGNGTCGSGTLSTSLNGAGYGTGFVYTHLGQLWQGPLNGTGTAQQYLYCESSHPHQLTGVFQAGSTCSSKNGQSYGSSYDAWGNETTRTVNATTATLSYDGLDELVKWDAASAGQEQYVYDVDGNRVLRRSTMAGITTMTVYAFGLEEHLYSGTGVNQGNTYYYSLAGHLIGELTNAGTNMVLTDALGSVITTISATAGSASVQGNQAYGPYGNTRYQAGSMGTAKGFTGQYQDATGLDYYNARDYDPVVGRFLSADTVEGNGAGMDPYAYVQDNPETHNDPTGHCGVVDLACWKAAAEQILLGIEKLVQGGYELEAADEKILLGLQELVDGDWFGTLNALDLLRQGWDLLQKGLNHVGQGVKHLWQGVRLVSRTAAGGRIFDKVPGVGYQHFAPGAQDNGYLNLGGSPVFDTEREARRLESIAQYVRSHNRINGNLGLASITILFKDGSVDRYTSPVYEGFDDLDGGNTTHSEAEAQRWVESTLLGLNLENAVEINVVIFTELAPCGGTRNGSSCRRDLPQWAQDDNAAAGQPVVFSVYTTDRPGGNLYQFY
jgi:RHS repeat-associated protein